MGARNPRAGALAKLARYGSSHQARGHHSRASLEQASRLIGRDAANKQGTSPIVVATEPARGIDLADGEVMVERADPLQFPA